MGWRVGSSVTSLLLQGLHFSGKPVNLHTWVNHGIQRRLAMHGKVLEKANSQTKVGEKSWAVAQPTGGGTGGPSETLRIFCHKSLEFEVSSILLCRLSRSGVGCFLGVNYVGALAYADDIVLLCPTPSAMRKLLSICDTFANEYDIKFTAQKSKLLVVSPSNRHRQATGQTYWW